MKTYKKLTLGLLALTTLSLSSCGIAGAPSDSSESMSSSSGASSSVSSSSSPSSEQAKTYTVTFNSNGGTPVEPQTVAEGEKIAKPADPTKEGNTFLKWTISGDEWFFGKDRVFEDITLDANWQINQYTITFDTDGGSPIDPITADYGAPITKPADPAKEGHTFLGWDKEIPSAMPAEDLAIKASWQVNQYTITWLNGMGGTLAETTLDFGSAVTPIESPSDPYYEFGGWNKEVPETMPASDVVITATWKQGPWTFSGSELTKYSGTAEHVEIPPYTPWGG